MINEVEPYKNYLDCFPNLGYTQRNLCAAR